MKREMVEGRYRIIQGSDEVEDDEEVEEEEPLMVGMVGVLERKRGRIITIVIFIIVNATWSSGCIVPAGGPGERWDVLDGDVQQQLGHQSHHSENQESSKSIDGPHWGERETERGRERGNQFIYEMGGWWWWRQ